MTKKRQREIEAAPFKALNDIEKGIRRLRVHLCIVKKRIARTI
jgi:hypothetical protein